VHPGQRFKRLSDLQLWHSDLTNHDQCNNSEMRRHTTSYTHTPPEYMLLAILPTDVNLTYDYQLITQSRAKRGLMGKVPAIAVTWDKTRDLVYEYLWAHLTASSCDSTGGNGRNVQCRGPLGLAAGRYEIRNTKSLEGNRHWIQLRKIYTSEQLCIHNTYRVMRVSLHRTSIRHLTLNVLMWRIG
jgi:hypothetical protein